MQKLRISFICPPDTPSGGSRVVAIYAKLLAQRGHRVSAVFTKRASPTIRQRASALAKRGIWLGAILAPTNSYFGPPVDVIYLNHSGPMTDRDVPDGDVVIATWWETAEWVYSLSKRKGAKLHFMQDYETWGTSDATRLDAATALPIPKIVIAHWVRDLLLERWGQEPIALIANSVETDKFFAPPRSKRPTPTVGFTYSPMHSKGADICIDAITAARRSLPALRALAFGQSQMPDASGIDFHLKVAEDALRSLYAACDAWLFGTRSEGFGLPILEAMACRTPVIGTPAGAFPSLVAKGGGIQVSAENPLSMAEAIAWIAAMDDNSWRQMSDAAYVTATSYSWADATDLFEDAIGRVLSVAGSTKAALCPPHR